MAWMGHQNLNIFDELDEANSGDQKETTPVTLSRSAEGGMTAWQHQTACYMEYAYRQNMSVQYLLTQPYLPLCDQALPDDQVKKPSPKNNRLKLFSGYFYDLMSPSCSSIQSIASIFGRIFLILLPTKRFG